MRGYLAGQGLRGIAVVSCTVLLAGVSAGAAAVGSVTSGNSGPAVPGGQLWVSRYNGPASGGEPATDAAISVALSPGGSAGFVTGISAGGGGGRATARAPHPPPPPPPPRAPPHERRGPPK